MIRDSTQTPSNRDVKSRNANKIYVAWKFSTNLKFGSYEFRFAVPGTSRYIRTAQAVFERLKQTHCIAGRKR